jgi:predicted nucleic acid-binding protein
VSAGFILDTSVVSLLAPGRQAIDDTIVRWMRENADRLHLSAVTIAEIEQGIAKLRRAGSKSRADTLETWLDKLIAQGGDRILPFDSKTARIAGKISDRAIAAGKHPGFADVAIAATAQVNDLRLLTRNGKHFVPLGIAFHDPADGVPN